MKANTSTLGVKICAACERKVTFYVAVTRTATLLALALLVVRQQRRELRQARFLRSQGNATPARDVCSRSRAPGAASLHSSEHGRQAE